MSEIRNLTPLLSSGGIEAKYGFFYISTLTSEEIDGFSGIEILDYKAVLAVRIYVEVYFIDRDDIREWKAVHIYKTVENFKEMGVRSVESARNGKSGFSKALEGKNDKYVGSVSDTAFFADKTEFLISLTTAVGICARVSPAVLL